MLKPQHQVVKYVGDSLFVVVPFHLCCVVVVVVSFFVTLLLLFSLHFFLPFHCISFLLAKCTKKNQ